jgi:hypothetical protein
MHGAAETFNFIFEELLFDVFLNPRVLTEFVYCKIVCDIYFVFYVFFESCYGTTDTFRFIFADLLFNICEKLRIHLENCFVILFFATAPCMAQLMHGAAETFNSIFAELIFGVFLNTKVLAEFVFYLILFEEYCEFRGK